jgi:hypothetical protein
MQTNDRVATQPGWIVEWFRAPVSTAAGPFTGPVEIPSALAVALIVLLVASGLVASRGGARVPGAEAEGFDSSAVVAGGTLVASPDRLEFDQPAGALTPARTVEVTNLGSRRIDLAEVAALNPAGTRSSAYKIDTDACRDGIPARGTCVLRVEFMPRTAGNHPATLTIAAGDSPPLGIVLQARAT